MEHMFAQPGYASHPGEDLSSRVHWSKVGKLNDNVLSLKEKWLHGFFFRSLFVFFENQIILRAL